MKYFPTSLARKVVFKLSLSRPWSKIRRILPGSKALIEYQDLIEKAQSAVRGDENRVFSIYRDNKQCVLMPADRGDGVGIQAMIRINLMFLASQARATYVHLPFTKLAHQSMDPIGQSINSTEWAAKWEAFFNFGKDEIHIADWANSMGADTLAEYLASNCRRVGKAKYAFLDVLSCLVEEIRRSDSSLSGVFTVDLGICTLPPERRPLIDADFVESLQRKFDNNGFQPEAVLFNNQHLNIAIHIRRGDAWEAFQAGSEMGMYSSRLVDEQYYVELLRRLKHLFRSSSRSVHFHIFSDGREEDFERFTFTSEGNAIVKRGSEILVDNIQFHLRHSTIDTLYHLIKAPILVPGKSAFSVVAALLNNSFIFYADEIREFYQYNVLEKLIESSPRFIQLSELEDRVEYVIEALQGES